jgi:predicted GNAT superfamily acetyltransferase
MQIPVFEPFPDGFPGMTDVTKPVFIQAFIVKVSVKTLNKSVLCRLSWLDKSQLHAVLKSPLTERAAGKFRALISYYRSRIAAKRCPEYA